MCHTPLEGASFIVDQANQPHCVDDYHRYGESSCMWCLKADVPSQLFDFTAKWAWVAHVISWT